MKVQLEKLEARIRELIEIRMLGLLPGQKIEQATIQQIASALYTNIEENPSTDTAPNIFTLIIPPEETSRWQDTRLLETLKETLLTIGRETNLKYSAPPTISVATDTSLTPGEVRVVASYKINNLGPTNAIINDNPPEVEDKSIPENAFLIVDGRKVFPLKDSIINIGRRLENQLTIDDPRVSRTHAQLRSIKGRYLIFDLDSTGGTFINGKRINQTILYPGDVISLAGVNLVFGQDNPLPRPDLKDTNPLSPDPLNRKTVIFKSPSDFLKPKK
jgi:hypothetical protein